MAIAAFALAQRCLGALALGDIGQHGEGPLKHAVLVQQGGNGNQNGHRVAVPMTKTALELVAAPLPVLPRAPFVIGDFLGQHKIADRAPRHVLRRIAQHLGHATVDKDGAKSGIRLPDAFIGGFHDTPIHGCVTSQLRTAIPV